MQPRSKKDKMMARKAYQDLTVDYFEGMTPEQIKEVLDTYEPERQQLEHQRQMLQKRLKPHYIKSHV